MTREEIDWSVIKSSTVIFTVILVINVSLILASWMFKEEMLDEYNKNKIRFASVSQQYLAVDEDEKIIRQYYPEFIALYKKGIIGREDRLNWVESLRASSEKNSLPELTYNISPQEKYTLGSGVELGKFELYSSKMNLSVGMLHEGDFLKLIYSMDKLARGIYTLTKCRFSRTGKTLSEKRDSTNVKADCELQWLNIRRSDGTEIKLS